MPVVATWDFENRRIYMAVADYDPIDIYREHRKDRSLNESSRRFVALCRAIGGIPKGGGQRFPNALQLIAGAKIVPLEGSTVNLLSGEVVTDDPENDPDPFDSSGLSGDRPRIVLQPVAQIIEVGGVASNGVSIDLQPVLDVVQDTRLVVKEINQNNPPRVTP